MLPVQQRMRESFVPSKKAGVYVRPRIAERALSAAADIPTSAWKHGVFGRKRPVRPVNAAKFWKPLSSLMLQGLLVSL